MVMRRSTRPGNAGNLILAAVLTLASPALFAGQADSQAAPSPAAQDRVQTTAPVIVNGKANPLARSDRRLSRIKKSLPGTDSAPSGSSSALGRYAAAHSDPNAANGQQRQMMQRADGPPAGNGPDSGVAPH